MVGAITFICLASFSLLVAGAVQNHANKNPNSRLAKIDDGLKDMFNTVNDCRKNLITK